MKQSYIYILMSEAFEKLRKAKDLEIEAILQMRRAELEDIVNENFINEKATLDVQDGRSKTTKEADK